MAISKYTNLFVIQPAHSIADAINNSGVKDPLFIAVMNGAFLFAADIMRKITIANSEISFIKPLFIINFHIDWIVH